MKPPRPTRISISDRLPRIVSRSGADEKNVPSAGASALGSNGADIKKIRSPRSYQHFGYDAFPIQHLVAGLFHPVLRPSADADTAAESAPQWVNRRGKAEAPKKDRAVFRENLARALTDQLMNVGRAPKSFAAPAARETLAVEVFSKVLDCKRLIVGLSDDQQFSPDDSPFVPAGDRGLFCGKKHSAR
jgi:hypothetical protein